MVEVVFYMLFLVSWDGSAATPTLERVPQIFTSQQACETAGKSALAKRGERKKAFKCLRVPDANEYDAAVSADRQS